MPQNADLDVTYEREFTIILDVIGDGSSSVVFKGLYMPTLTFLAIKRITTSSSDLADKLVSAELQVAFDGRTRKR